MARSPKSGLWSFPALTLPFLIFMALLGCSPASSLCEHSAPPCKAAARSPQLCSCGRCRLGFSSARVLDDSLAAHSSSFSSAAGSRLGPGCGNPAALGQLPCHCSGQGGAPEVPAAQRGDTEPRAGFDVFALRATPLKHWPSSAARYRGEAPAGTLLMQDYGP